MIDVLRFVGDWPPTSCAAAPVWWQRTHCSGNSSSWRSKDRGAGPVGTVAALRDGACRTHGAGVARRHVARPAGDHPPLAPGRLTRVLATTLSAIGSTAYGVGGVAEEVVSAVEIDPTNSNHLVATSPFATGYQSADGGGSWEEVPMGGRTRSPSIRPIPGRSTSGASSASWKTTDGGRTVDEISTFRLGQFVSRIVVDPGNRQRVFALTYDAGLWRSTDGGAHFSPIGDFSVGTDLLIGRDAPWPLFVSDVRGVSQNNNAGSSFAPLGAQHPFGHRAAALARDATTGTMWAAAGSNFYPIDGAHGVARLDARVWTPVDDGLPYPNVLALALAPDGRTRWAGTAGGSTYRFTARPCPVTPLAGCRTPVRAHAGTVSLHHPADPADATLRWEWRRGAATTLAEFAAPSAERGYTLCLYDAPGAAAARLVATLRIPGEDRCGPSCWGRDGKRTVVYAGDGPGFDGVARVRLRAGRRGKAAITVDATGPALPVPALPLTPPVRVQLLGGATACWEAVYTRFVARSDARRFKTHDGPYPGK